MVAFGFGICSQLAVSHHTIFHGLTQLDRGLYDFIICGRKLLVAGLRK